MSVTLPLQRIGNHLFVQLQNELLLVDTGASDSYSEGKVRMLAPGLRITHHRSPMVETRELHQGLAVPAAGVLGMDILGRCDVVFDQHAGAITLSLSALARPPHALALRTVIGVPVFDLSIAEGVGSASTDLTVFLDSGTQYSYLPPRRIASRKVGKVQDFSAILGPIKATLYERTRLDRPSPRRFCVPHRFAEPPNGLATLLRLAGADGILGLDAFERPVLLSARQQWVAQD